VNKAAVIGAIIIVIIGIVIVSATTMDFSVEEEGSVSEEIAIEQVVEEEIAIEEVVEEAIAIEQVVEEAIAIEEVVEEEIAIEEEPEVVEEEGKDLTVELTESMNLSTP